LIANRQPETFKLGHSGLLLQVWIQSDMAPNQPIRGGANSSGPPASDIPDKLYFRIGEVARLCEVPAYVLRFWESEFPQLKPNKGGTGQRLYRRRDVEMALRVKTLLKEEGYTIPGARAVLKAEFKHKEPQLSLIPTAAPNVNLKQLRVLRRELEAIAAILSRPAGKSAAAHKAHAEPSSSVQPMRRPRNPSSLHGETPENLFDPAE
jgi:DNA-binding transcriptional MerR regulator